MRNPILLPCRGPHFVSPPPDTKGRGIYPGRRILAWLLFAIVLLSIELPSRVSAIGESHLSSQTIDDSWVSQCEPTYVKQTGDPNTLLVESRSGESPPCTGAGWHSNGRILVKFGDIPITTSDRKTIVLAELTLFEAPDGVGTIRFYEVRRVTSAWTENTVTWDIQPTTTNANVSSHSVNPAVSSITPVIWNVTGIVASWVTGDANLGVQIRDGTEDSANTNATGFLSKERDLPGRPDCCGAYLNITYIDPFISQATIAVYIFGFTASLVLMVAGAYWVKKKRSGS